MTGAHLQISPPASKSPLSTPIPLNRRLGFTLIELPGLRLERSRVHSPALLHKHDHVSSYIIM